MRIKNINECWGDPVSFDSVEEMAAAITNCGMELPEDGLVEGRDYMVLEDAAKVILTSQPSPDGTPHKWIARIFTEKYGVRTLEKSMEVLAFPHPLSGPSINRMIAACYALGAGDDNPIIYE